MGWLCAMVKAYSPKTTALGIAYSGFLAKHGLSARGRSGLATQGTGTSATTHWRVENTVISILKQRHQQLMLEETVVHMYDNLHRYRGLYKLIPGKGNVALLDWTVFCLSRNPQLVKIPRFPVPDGIDFRTSMPGGLLFGAGAQTVVVGLQEKASALMAVIREGHFFHSTLVSKEEYIDRPRTPVRGEDGNVIVGRVSEPRVERSLKHWSHAGAVLAGIEPTG